MLREVGLERTRNASADGTAHEPALRSKSERITKITTAIADAVTREQVFEAVVDRVAAELDASTVALWLVEGDRAVLARAMGYTPSSLKSLEQIPLDVSPSIPVIDCMRDRAPLFIDSQGELLALYPNLAPVLTPGRHYGVGCLPIVVEDKTLGGLGFTFDNTQKIDAEQRNALLLVARYSAQALERLRLLDVERDSRRKVEASAARLGILNRTSRAFYEAAPDLPLVLQTIAEQITREHADMCGVFLLSADGRTLDAGGVHHRDPGATEDAKAMVKAHRYAVGEGLVGKVALGGEPVFIPEIDREKMLAAGLPAYRGWLERHMPISTIAVPIRAHGKVAGVLTESRELGSQPFIEEDLHLATELADRAGLAIERSQLHKDNYEARARSEELYRLARSVITAASVEQVFEAALEAIARVLGTDRCSILTFDAAGVMRFRASRGLTPEYRAAVEGHSPWTRGTRDPQPIVVEDVARDETLAPYGTLFQREQIGALGFIPLTTGGEVIGKFMVYYGEPRAMAAHELDLAHAIANHVAAAISRFSAIADLEQTVRFNEMFTGILGHDLRNPLGAIIMAAQVALMREEGVKLAKPLSRILSSGQRMSRMIDQLLDFTRVRMRAGIPIVRSSTNLVAVMREVIDELDNANPEWTLSLDHHGELDGSWDADRLAQVFSNLVGNAIQHGIAEHGVRVTADGTDATAVRVSVHNRGTIAPERVGSLFEPVELPNRPRDKTRGLGLGLYITREILRAHGGSIEVRSDPAGGTTFTVKLPRR